MLLQCQDHNVRVTVTRRDGDVMAVTPYEAPPLSAVTDTGSGRIRYLPIEHVHSDTNAFRPKNALAAKAAPVAKGAGVSDWPWMRAWTS